MEQQEDFIRELGLLSLTIRLKRISDKMLQDGKRMYKTLNLDIEPNWFLIFKILKKYKSLSVTEISDKLHYAHPSVITIVEKMTKKGYIQSVKCDDDSRRRLITLSKKAVDLLPKLEEVWSAGTIGVGKMVDGLDILSVLNHLEDQLLQQDFMNRTIDELKVKA